MLGYTLYKLYTSHTFNEYFNCHHFPPKETYNLSNILNHLLKTIIYMYAFFGGDKTHQNITHPRFCSENQPSCVLVSTFRAWLGRWVGGSEGTSREGRQGERCRRSEARCGASIFAGSRTGETNQGVARLEGGLERERGETTWLDLPVFSTGSLGFHDSIWLTFL